MKIFTNIGRAILLSIATLMAISLSGCAVPPTQDEIQALPVIQLGDTVPENGQYVLYLPADKVMITTVEIKGDVFQQEATQLLSVKLKRDIYSYKNWLSYDKTTWLGDNDALGIRLNLKLPSYYYPHPGKISLQIYEKNK